jgi:hypothetical protein
MRILKLKNAFQTGKASDPITNSLYFNVKRMQEIQMK